VSGGRLSASARQGGASAPASPGHFVERIGVQFSPARVIVQAGIQAATKTPLSQLLRLLARSSSQPSATKKLRKARH